MFMFFAVCFISPWRSTLERKTLKHSARRLNALGDWWSSRMLQGGWRLKTSATDCSYSKFNDCPRCYNCTNRLIINHRIGIIIILFYCSICTVHDCKHAIMNSFFCECHSCQHRPKKMRDVLLISLAFTWHLPHQHIEEPERGGCPLGQKG